MTEVVIDRRFFLTGVVAAATIALPPTPIESYPLVVTATSDKLVCIIYDTAGKILAWTDKVTPHVAIANEYGVASAQIDLQEDLVVEQQGQHKLALARDGHDLFYKEMPTLYEGDRLIVKGFQVTL